MTVKKTFKTLTDKMGSYRGYPDYLSGGSCVIPRWYVVDWSIFYGLAFLGEVGATEEGLRFFFLTNRASIATITAATVIPATVMRV